MAEGRAASDPDRDAIGARLFAAYLFTISLARALFFTVAALAMFLAAFLGYFTISFLFLTVALLLFAFGTAGRRQRRTSGRPAKR